MSPPEIAGPAWGPLQAPSLDDLELLAGDAFNAAFAVAFSGGQDAFASAAWATAVAALSVTRHGAQASMPSQNEVDRFLSLTESLKA